MKRIAVVFILAVLLTGCTNSEAIQPILNSDITDTGYYESESVEPEDKSESAYTTVSEKIQTECASDSSSTVDWSSFSLAELVGEFDDAHPLHYTVDKMTDTSGMECYSAAEEALLSSEYFAEAEQIAREFFAYENGVITPVSEHFWTEFHNDDVIVGEDGNLSVSIELAYSCDIAFDGVNTEQIYVFRIPLPLSEIEWSGCGGFYVPVYVNSTGAALVLSEAAAQTMSQPVIISYEDGVSHVEFGRGHTSGTAWSMIFGFSDGQPHLLYECSVLAAEQDSGSCILREDNCIGFLGFNLLFFRDKERGYCTIGGELLSGEDTELIAEHPAISESYPDIGEKTLYLTGGRYITSTDNDCFELKNGQVIPYEHGVIIPVPEFYERVPEENILSIDLCRYE